MAEQKRYVVRVGKETGIFTDRSLVLLVQNTNRLSRLQMLMKLCKEDERIFINLRKGGLREISPLSKRVLLWMLRVLQQVEKWNIKGLI